MPNLRAKYGLIPPGDLGSGTPDSSKFLRGDGTWNNTLAGPLILTSISATDSSGISLQSNTGTVVAVVSQTNLQTDRLGGRSQRLGVGGGSNAGQGVCEFWSALSVSSGHSFNSFPDPGAGGGYFNSKVQLGTAGTVDATKIEIVGTSSGMRPVVPSGLDYSFQVGSFEQLSVATNLVKVPSSFRSNSLGGNTGSRLSISPGPGGGQGVCEVWSALSVASGVGFGSFPDPGAGGIYAQSRLRLGAGATVDAASSELVGTSLGTVMHSATGLSNRLQVGGVTNSNFGASLGIAGATRWAVGQYAVGTVAPTQSGIASDGSHNYYNVPSGSHHFFKASDTNYFRVGLQFAELMGGAYLNFGNTSTGTSSINGMWGSSTGTVINSYASAYTSIRNAGGQDVAQFGRGSLSASSGCFTLGWWMTGATADNTRAGITATTNQIWLNTGTSGQFNLYSEGSGTVLMRTGYYAPTGTSNVAAWGLGQYAGSGTTSAASVGTAGDGNLVSNVKSAGTWVLKVAGVDRLRSFDTGGAAGSMNGAPFTVANSSNATLMSVTGRNGVLYIWDGTSQSAVISVTGGGFTISSGTPNFASTSTPSASQIGIALSGSNLTLYCGSAAGQSFVATYIGF